MGLSPLFAGRCSNHLGGVAAGTTVLLVDRREKRSSIADRAYVLETGRS